MKQGGKERHIGELQIWFTAQEIADFAAAGVMRGMPETKRGVNEVIERENWEQHFAYVKKEKGVGGIITRYHLEQLPCDVRLSYLIATVTQRRIEPYYLVRPKSARSELVSLAKNYLITEADKFREQLHMGAFVADSYFAQMYCDGRYLVPEWIKEVIEKFSARSLARWREKATAYGTGALAHDPALSRKGKGLLETANNGEVKMRILAWIANKVNLKAHHIRDYIEDEFGAELVDAHGEFVAIPPLRTFQHFIAGLKKEHKVVLTKIQNPDKYRSHYQLSGVGAFSFVKEPNELWQIDASPVDALCVDGRYSMYGCLDIATRRYVITLSKTPRSEAVNLNIRKALLKLGVPTTIKTDNGSDFKAKAVFQFLEKDLKINIDPSDAYSPEQKGHIERAIKTFQHDVGPQLPGYIGHNVTDRKAIESRKSFSKRLHADEKDLFEVSLTAEELQHYIDEWLEFVYHERPHAGLNKKTPNEVTQASGHVMRFVDERALDVLLMPLAGSDGKRMVTKRGIRIDNVFYMTSAILPNTKVLVRLDPMDMAKIYVFSEDGAKFLDVAVCPELSNINRTEFVAARKAEFNELISVQEKAIKKSIRELQKGASGIERTLRVAKARKEQKDAINHNVIAMPKRDILHVTESVNAAMRATTFEKRKSEPRPLSAAAQAIHDELNNPKPVQENVVSIDPDAGLSELQRMLKWAVRMEERIAAGDKPDDETMRRLSLFKSTPEYQAMCDCMSVFGFENAIDMFSNHKKSPAFTGPLI